MTTTIVGAEEQNGTILGLGISAEILGFLLFVFVIMQVIVKRNKDYLEYKNEVGFTEGSPLGEESSWNYSCDNSNSDDYNGRVSKSHHLSNNNNNSSLDKITEENNINNNNNMKHPIITNNHILQKQDEVSVEIENDKNVILDEIKNQHLSTNVENMNNNYSYDKHENLEECHSTSSTSESKSWTNSSSYRWKGAQSHTNNFDPPSSYSKSTETESSD